MERLGIANAEIGLLVELFSLPVVVLALPGGMLGQRIGDRRLVVAAMLLMTVGSVLVGVATAFPAAVVGRLLMATGPVLLNVLGTAMVAGWFSDREIALAMAVFLNAWPVGNGLALLMLRRSRACGPPPSSAPRPPLPGPGVVPRVPGRRRARESPTMAAHSLDLWGRLNIPVSGAPDLLAVITRAQTG